jgi:hypothetical protein
MSLDELIIGEEVKVYDKHQRRYKGFGKPQPGYRLKLQGKIIEIKPEYILVNRGYNERFDIIDLRRRRYRIFKVNGNEVKFPPLPDKVAIEEEMKRKTHEEYQNTVGKSEKASEEKRKAGTTLKWEKIKQLLDAGKTPEEAAEQLKSTIWIVKGLMTRYKYKIREDDNEMAMMTKEVVRKMVADGMDVDSIVKHFEPSYPNARPSVIKAKVAMLLSDKPRNPRKKKEKQSESDNDVYIMKHDAAAENLPVPEPEVDTKVEQNQAVETENDGHVKHTIVVPERKVEQAKEIFAQSELKSKCMTINPELEKAIAEMEEEDQLKRDREALKLSTKLLDLKMKLAEAAQIKRKPLLKPKCLIGELTGREYIFQEEGVCVSVDTVNWEELEDFIEELRAVREMKNA